MNIPKLAFLAGTALSLCMAAAAQAQVAANTAAPPATDADGGIADIVVTARKISESLQRTPVAVSAIDTESLERRQLTNISQLQNSTPALTISSAVAQPGSATLFIRGQGSTDGLIAIDQAVGTYINGVYSARSSGGAFDMIDIRQVEILRGPQGTLFGRNTTGGAINIIPNTPTGEFEAYAKGNIGNYDAWSAEAMLNLPMKGDELGLRLAYKHRQQSGHGLNATLGNRIGGENSEFVRASLNIAPADQPWSVLIQGDYTDLRTGGQLTGLRSFTPGVAINSLVLACSGGFGPAFQALCPVATPAGDSLANYVYGANGNNNIYRVANDLDIFGNAKVHGVSATINYDLSDRIAIKSISAWRGVNTISQTDNDGTPYLITGSLFPDDGNIIKQDQFQQEIQLTGKMDGLQWILGGFYFVENGLDFSKTENLWPLSTAISIIDGDVRNESKAAFGQFTYNITDAARVTAGLRYTKDERRLRSRNRNRNAFTGVETSSFPSLVDDPASDRFLASFANSFDYWSYTLGLDWQAAPGIFLYAKTSRAYRSGGLNTRTNDPQIPPTSFEPERVTDYEIGGKFDLLDRRVRFNWAAYYSEIDNVQRNIIGSAVINGSTTLVSGAANAASAHIWGGEAELTVVPVEGLTLGATMGLTYPKYDSFINTLDPNPATRNLVNSEFPYTPKQTYTASIDYELPASGLGGVFNFHADYSLRTKAYAISLPAAQQELARIPGYDLVNARVSFRLDDPNIEFAVFGQNLFKKKYITRLLVVENTPLGFTSYGPGMPRTYGASIAYRF